MAIMDSFRVDFDQVTADEYEAVYTSCGKTVSV